MAPKKSSSGTAMKRSIARRFNDSLVGRGQAGSVAKTLDQRTAKRLARYRVELKGGRKGNSKDLTPLDVAIRVNELLKHGDRLTDIRKLSKPREVDYDEKLLVGVLKEMHPHYQFRPEAYRYAGVQNEALVASGILKTMPAKRGPTPKKKAAAKPKATTKTKAATTRKKPAQRKAKK
jgi:hypothetical protein